MLRAGAIALLATTLAACAHAPDRAFSWGLDAGSGRTTLVYGWPDSDNIALGLGCDPGSGEVSITYALVDHPRSATLVVAAGPVTMELPARIESYPGDDSWLVTATAPASSPLFGRFKASRRLTVRAGRHAWRAPPAPAADVSAFIAACQR